MGFGDPDHPHPLNFYNFLVKKQGICFRCELPIIDWDNRYGCARCNHFVHQLCFELPQNMRHPLHPQHPLTLSPSPGSQITALCNQCHNPFLGGYMYHCQVCLKFNIHLKCFLTLNLEPKHEHPLCLYEVASYGPDKPTCRTCGLLIDVVDSYTFACKGCNIYIHFDCTFLPPTVNHRHGHELTFEYNYPEESDLAYCDVCEDRDDEELDRNLSYYYCKKCDYIAHVLCVTTKPATVTTHLEHHEHPMFYSRKPRRDSICCACKSFPEYSFYYCGQCNYQLHKSCADFPRFIKHPHHKEHSLSFRSPAALNPDGELSSCNFCHRGLEGNGLVLQCKDCDYVEHLGCAVSFKHPHHTSKLLFSAYYNTFRCNACGDLGEGYRMSHSDVSLPLHYDLHLECFALPGKIEHSCHYHPLYLISSPSKIKSDLSTTFACDICHAEADPEFWIYCCKQCNYIAHLKCVASDLFSAFKPSNSFVDLSSITEFIKGQFIDEATKLDIGTCLRLVREDRLWEFSRYPFVSSKSFFKDPKPPFGDQNRQPIISDVTDLEKPFIDVLHCLVCEQPISVQAYSSVHDWVHCNVKANLYPVQVENPIDYESLAMLDEKVVDKLYCSICYQLIFAPTYSCAECQIFFHKSCAELPRKYSDDDEHMFVLQSPSMCNGSLTNCKFCKHPIKGFAYFCTSCETVLDVTCALGAPLLKLENQKHSFFGKIAYLWDEKCQACDHKITKGSFFFKCQAPSCYFDLHVECAMLPYSVKHRIHHHSLVLEPHLDLSVDDYICDVCEKELNPCIWVYRCSNSCGDRATSHISCIITSNKKCHFIYEEECSYPHLDQISLFKTLKQKRKVPGLATFLENAPPKIQERLLYQTLSSCVDELEHEYAPLVTRKLMKMHQAEILHLMESPDELKAKVAESMKSLILSGADDDNDYADSSII